MLKGASKLQLALLLLWLTFTFLSFRYFTLERLADFDPQGKLSNISNEKFVEYLSNSFAEQAHAIINFYNPNCACNVKSEQHILELNKASVEKGFTFKNIAITDSNLIPSTPSVAIVDKFGELVYFGPYGEGLDCGQTDGYALTVLNNHLKGYTSDLIIKLAKGCYCNT